MKVLIADDDKVTLLLLKKIVSKSGFEPILATDGQIAWEIFQNQKIDMVITDWLMPRMNGLELCKKLRQSDIRGYTYIILLTSKSEKDDRIEVYETGADDFIPKPLDIDELTVRLNTGKRVLDLERRHKKMQSVLIESRDKLKVVLDALPEEIVSVDKKLNILSVNKAYIQSRGLAYKDVLGKPLITSEGRLYGGREAGVIPKLIEQLLDEGTPRTQIDTITNEDNSEQHLEIHGLPVRTDSGTRQAVIVIRDITEERQRSQEITALNKALKKAIGEKNTKNKTLEETLIRLKESQTQILQSEKMASIGQLAAGVAHEINNPTGFVSSNLKTLNDYQEDLNGVFQKYGELI
ncbi:MAG: response regulator, partial [Desulfobacteraceae bacterium]|nr:response regulator [Desulfobacteraceae bacterium]